MTSAERQRVESFGHPEDGLYEATPWHLWGPYLSERAWGTVHEDYSPGGDAWDSSLMITLAPAPTAGARMAWPASPTSVRSCAWRWRCGTAAIRS